MAQDRPNRTDDEVRALSRHLLYEIEMVAHTATWLHTMLSVDGPDPLIRSTLRNAMLESWAVHIRNLLSFIYDDRPGRGSAIAAHFVDDDWRQMRRRKPDVLRLAHAKASKEITHPLYGHAEMTEEQRTRHIEPILVELGNVLHRFFDAVPAMRLRHDFRERAVAALPKRDVAMSAHGLRVASSSMISLVQLKQTGD